MYHTIEDLLQLSKEEKKPLYRIVLENEMRLTETGEAEVLKRLEQRYQVMEEEASKALTQERKTVGSLITGITKPQYAYACQGEGLCGSFINLVMARALSCSEVNASMGKICAAPTAGACGILPAVLISIEEKEKLPRSKALEGLLVASGIGAVIMKNATVAGAEGGCQAECGVAAAMAAAAAVHLKDGTNEMIGSAVAFALMNCMGLVCDPVAGLVQVPCAQRNASQAVNALLSADLALAGMKTLIPPDEVVEAMYRVGKLLPYQLKETALGGLAKTKTAQAITKEIFGKE
jgi:L-serine dehydratase